MKYILTFLLLLVFSLALSQDIPSRFSLQEAIDYALKNNRTAKNAARDVDAAKQQKWETTATGLPQINVDANYQNFLELQQQGIPATFIDPDASPNDLIPAAFGAENTAVASATLSQLLFDGSYIVALQSSKVFLDISKNAKTKTDLEIRKGVINAYGNVLLAEESVKILEKNISVLEKNLNETTKIYESGLEEEESVEQLQITLSGLKSNLSNAKRLEGIAKQIFNITLGIDFGSKTALTDTLESLTEQNMSLEVLKGTNDITQTVDYLIAENDLKSNELLVKLEKSKALPTLSASLTGGFNTFSNDFTIFNTNNNWYDFALLGFNLKVPVFSSGLRSAATQRAKINLEKSKDNLIETEQNLNLQIETAKSNHKFAIEDYSNKKQNLDLAERIEKKNQTKFFEGVGSSFELRQAQTQLYSAQQELLQAMLDIITTKAELETITNKID